MLAVCCSTLPQSTGSRHFVPFKTLPSPLNGVPCDKEGTLSPERSAAPPTGYILQYATGQMHNRMDRGQSNTTRLRSSVTHHEKTHAMQQMDHRSCVCQPPSHRAGVYDCHPCDHPFNRRQQSGQPASDCTTQGKRRLGSALMCGSHTGRRSQSLTHAPVRERPPPPEGPSIRTPIGGCAVGPQESSMNRRTFVRGAKAIPNCRCPDLFKSLLTDAAPPAKP